MDNHHVLIAGVSTRALAVSAFQAGYRVSAIDAFGDRDLQAVADVLVPRDASGRHFDPVRAATAGRNVAAGLAAYTSNFENYPLAVATLAHGRELLGNPPAVLEAVRDPLKLARTLRRHGIPVPLVRASAPSHGGPSQRWLLKPRRSGGGHGIQAWRQGLEVPRRMYLQQRIIGLPGSVIFAADGRRAVVLGVSRQVVGDAGFGSRGFRYCGSLVGDTSELFPRHSQLVERAGELAQLVTREFSLVGLNGIDFIARDGIPYPLEVNPRFSASMELLEKGESQPLFRVHLAACRGILPTALKPEALVHGKAVVFARRAITIHGPAWTAAADDHADLPHPGERIQRGRPICTVFATGQTADACRTALLHKASRVYRATELQVRRVS
jgi:uncharacterized protein